MFANMSRSALAALALASRESEYLGHYYLGVEHILIGLCKTDDAAIARAMGTAALDPVDMRRRVRAALPQGAEPPWGRKLIVTPRTDRVIQIARRIARHHGAEQVEASHLLLAMLVEGESVGVRALAAGGVNLEGLQRALAESLEGAAAEARQNPLARQTPTLNQFGRDLTQEARQGKLTPLIGRDAELKRIAQILLRKTKNNPLIVGESGVGKSCVVYGLAQYLASEGVLEALRNRRVVEVNMASVVAGTKYRGEFEERLQQIVAEARRQPEVILFFDEIHSIVGAGAASGSLDAANILKPPLANGEISCIGVTTLAEFRKHIEPDAALERRFEVVQLAEPTPGQTLEILRGLRAVFEAHHEVRIADDALAAAVRLAERYITDRHFPDKAIDLIDSACTQARLETIHGKPAEGRVVDKADVARVVSQKIDEPIPEGDLSREDADKALRLEEALRRRVVGQDEAVGAVARVVRSHLAGLSDPRRPIAVLLFVGPTGVGKTELARALACAWFGSERKLLRFDMSEYTEAHTVSRLLGSPPGYVGHEQEGQLSRAVRTHPYSLILLDEVEKAHPDVLKIFLQVFDAGRLTDAKGRTLNFSNTVIIMTSNVGAALKNRPVGFLTQDDREWSKHLAEIREGLKEAFPAEFRNRIDSEVIFSPLTAGPTLRRILEIQLDDVRGSLEERRLRLEVEEPAMQAMLQAGFSREYGARELRRTVQRMLRDPLAGRMLAGDFQPGDTVLAKADAGGQVVLERGANPPR
jgi:ATP-dependent Clp protease ATP-binding subunit ClpC